MRSLFSMWYNDDSDSDFFVGLYFVCIVFNLRVAVLDFMIKYEKF